MRINHFAFAMLVALCSVQALWADLVVDISGVAGSGTTTWVFSGTEVAGADENFDSGFLNDFGSVWVDHGDLFNSGWTNTNITPPSGVTITTSYGTESVNQLYMTEQGILDDFGIGVTNNLPFDENETISWTGSFVLNEDLQNMNIGSYSFDYFANIFGTLDLTVNIFSSSGPAVPEPGVLGVLSLLSLCALRRRKS